MGLCFELQTCPPSTGLNMRFLFVGPGLCLRLPSDSTSRWTPLPLANASCYRARSGLAPPSYRPCRAHNYKKDCVHYGAVLFAIPEFISFNWCHAWLCISAAESPPHSAIVPLQSQPHHLGRNKERPARTYHRQSPAIPPLN